MSSIGKFTVGFLLCCFAASYPCAGVTLDVPSQFSTIQAAIDNANSGDIVLVSPGIYYENINFKGKNLTLTSRNPNDPDIVAATIIDGSRPVNADAASVVTFKTGETRAAVLRGFTITGGIGTKIKASSLPRGGGIYCAKSTPIISQNIILNNFSDSGGGVFGYYNANPLIYKNIIVNNIASGWGGSVYAGPADVVSNVMFNNRALTGAGICSYGGIIKNNLIFNNYSNSSSGVYLSGVTNSIITGNTLYGNSSLSGGSNLDLRWCDNITVSNNIICGGLTTPGVYFDRNTNITFKYNDVWNNAAGNYSGIADQSDINDNISVDPLFASPDNNDFHLQPASRCINTGDPQYTADANETDMDGEPRIISDNVDMGADEFGINRAPASNAGPDQSFAQIPLVVLLDGSASCDPENDLLIFKWRQVNGPSVNLAGSDTAKPQFIPKQFGIYVFELVVNDTKNDSWPDKVGIVIGNKAPIAEAGKTKYINGGNTTLDGTGSYDPDGYSQLTFKWRQISGPGIIEISGADSAEPLVNGFVQTTSVQKFIFELIVSDGSKTSKPSNAEVIVVPPYGNVQFAVTIPPFDPEKPTILGFNGGNCSSGSKLEYGDRWATSVNWLTTDYSPPYNRYGDALIVYLSSIAPGYKYPIQTIGHSTGSMPAIDSAIQINSYKDSRYTVNHVTLLDASCRDYSASIQEYLHSAVEGEQCWVENLYSTNSRLYPNVLNIQFPAPPADHAAPWYWYKTSLYPEDLWSTDEYNNGLTAGAFISVCGKAKNFQMVKSGSYYAFTWVGHYDSASGVFSKGYLAQTNATAYPGKILSPITLVGPADGNTIDTTGAVLSCQPSRNAVKYQLLMGPDSYTMNLMLCETSQPPQKLINTFPYETTYWTVKAYDQFGSSIFADPICVKTANVARPISNPLGKDYLTCTGYELVLQKRLARTVFEYCFKMKVKNMGFNSMQNVTMDLNSVPDNMTALNSKAYFSSIPAQQEAISDDTFIVRIDRAYPSDENDIIWQVSNKLEGDFSGDGKINFADLSLFMDNWLRTGSNMTVDLYRDQIINLVDLAIFAERWHN